MGLNGGKTMSKRPPANTRNQTIVCAFCHETPETKGRMVESEGNPAVYICHQCVKECAEVLDRQKERTSTTKEKLSKLPVAKDIVAFMDRHIIGQDYAKKRLAVRVMKHYRQLIDIDEREDVSKGAIPSVAKQLAGVVIKKQNMLLHGPTGSGKTLLAQTIAKILNVPFAIADATVLTEAGYVGEDVEGILLKLLMAADYDVERAQRGILYIDEIDKKCRTTSNVSITRDVSGEGVQQALLKILEGTVANIAPQGGRKHPEQQYIQMDTSNILFIVGGAFNGLVDIVGKRLSRKTIGFSNAGRTIDDTQEEWDLLQHATDQEFIEAGLIPELVGRLPVIVPLKRLEVPELIRVLTEPENALLKQEQKDAYFQGVDLRFTDGGIRRIAEKAHKKGTGARGLDSVVSEFMDDISFELNDSHRGSTIVVDERVVDGTVKASDLLTLHCKAA